MQENKKKEQSPGLIMRALDFAYEKAIAGVTTLDSAAELAESYLREDRNLIKSSDSLINWQISKAGTSGFLTGVGGLVTLPVSIPANLASVMYIQVRMIAAIAHMGGYNLRDDKVKTFVFLCMAGNGAKDIIKDVGIAMGEKLTLKLIESISQKSIQQINQKVGFNLLTKYGSSGAIKLGKAVPLVGGIIGGTFDAVTTRTIGKLAQNTFLED